MTLPLLPVTANPDSQERFKLAVIIARQCPLLLGEAIAITGSVSRGVADEFSDIEFRFLVTSLQPQVVYHEWLRSIGGFVEWEDDAVTATSVMTKSWHNGIFVEALWQIWEDLDASLERIISAQTVAHWDLTEAWHIADAIPLRPHQRLYEWQECLQLYPAVLQQRLIENAVLAWLDPPWWPVSFATIWPLARRNARLALANRLSREVERGLRLLFASNERWEPDYKWLASESQRLTRAPDDLVGRVNAIFALADAAVCVTTCLKLLRDIIDLVPAQYPMDLPRQHLQEVLDEANLPQSRG